MVAMLAGWIDAAGTAAGSMEALIDDCSAESFRSFDGDTYIDYRARRPVMELRSGINIRLRWPTIDALSGRDHHGQSVIGIVGPEPDMAWHRFCRSVGDLATEMGVRQFVALGAYPYGIPHTRPPKVVTTTPDPTLMPDGSNQPSIDLPAGVTAALEHEMFDRGIPAYGLWVQVPHYLSSMPFPTASVALLDELTRLSGVAVSAADLRHRAIVQRERIDKLVADNDEHQSMVAKLEAAYDSQAAGTVDPEGPGLEFRSGDQLAAEAEKFLRDLGE